MVEYLLDKLNEYLIKKAAEGKLRQSRESEIFYAMDVDGKIVKLFNYRKYIEFRIKTRKDLVDRAVEEHLLK